MFVIIMVAIALFCAFWISYQRFLKDAALGNSKRLTFIYEAKRNGHDIVKVYYKGEYLMSYKWKDGHKAESNTYLEKMHKHFVDYTKYKYRELILPSQIHGVAQPRKQ